MCFQLVGVRGTQRMKLPAVSRLNLVSNQSRGNAELQVEQVQVQCASSVASKIQTKVNIMVFVTLPIIHKKLMI